jgi:diguanylate cyclase (GGDEF)-like protein/PAS domain S-box-containing protein
LPRFGKQLLLCVCFILFYVFLNLPAVIVVSRLGFTAWYPAAGLRVIILLGIGPRYAPLVVLADVMAGALLYHQSLWSWTGTAGVAGITACYVIAAYLLRGPLRIDIRLTHRSDVFRYVSITLCAAMGSTLIGVSGLLADHTIPRSQFWNSAAAWFVGDATGVLGFGPFLLLYVVPAVRRYILPSESRVGFEDLLESQPGVARFDSLELALQLFAITFTLWFVFVGPLASRELYYLAYLPIIWVAVRQGIRPVVTALLIFNFGIVATIRIFPVPADVSTRVGFLMLVISGLGLVVGSIVTERHRLGDQLAERTMYLDSLIENTPLGIVVHDRQGKVELCNDAFENLFMFPREEIVGNDIDAYIVPPNKADEGRRFVTQLASGKRIQANVQRQRKDGAYVDTELYAVPLVRNGVISGGIAIYADVTEKTRVAATLKENTEALRRSVAELQVRTNQASLLKDMGDLLQSCEVSAEAIAVATEFGGRLFGQAGFGELYLLKPSRNAVELEGRWGSSKTAVTGFLPSECWGLRSGKPHWSECPNGKLICQHLQIRTSSSDLCVPMVARGETLGVMHVHYDALVTVDLGDPRDWKPEQTLLCVSVATQTALSLGSLRLRESLRDQSIRDPLTGLFNRRFMQESLDREVLRAGRKGRPLALIYLDIDHFKRFNDVFGHEAGDVVLRAMADTMRTFFRGDDVICRLGGEEFAIILPESGEEEAATRMTELREQIKLMTLFHHGRPLDHISLSAGISSFPKNGSSLEALLEVADRALYESKTHGRDRVTIAV